MKQQTKTIRLLYPDYISGGLDCYYLGAKLMERILPENEAQKLVRVNIEPPSKQKPDVTGGMYGRDVVMSGIKDAMDKIAAENPDKIITIGGNCMISQAAFDYLYGKYPEL